MRQSPQPTSTYFLPPSPRKHSAMRANLSSSFASFPRRIQLAAPGGAARRHRLADRAQRLRVHTGARDRQQDAVLQRKMMAQSVRKVAQQRALILAWRRSCSHPLKYFNEDLAAGLILAMLFRQNLKNFIDLVVRFAGRAQSRKKR